MTERTERDIKAPAEAENFDTLPPQSDAAENIEAIRNDTESANYSDEHIADFEEESTPYESDTGDAMEGEEGAPVNYEELARRDLEELTARFPETRILKSITSLPNALRYAELRDLGLTATEAYLASGRLRPASDNRSHLHSQVPKGSSDTGSYMKASELNSAREIFSSLSDAEIQRLYKRVIS